MTRKIFVFAIATMAATLAGAEERHQPYKGLESREISSLSDEDVAALKSGSGWGLALPAELNGHPGPAHILELGDQLGLSPEQRQQVSLIFEEMRTDAIEKGKMLIAAERDLDHGFKSGGLNESALQLLIRNTETVRADLRFVHLSRHLATIKILSEEQIALYAELRGYKSDPCENVPGGHDATMWRRHNGCDGP